MKRCRSFIAVIASLILFITTSAAQTAHQQTDLTHASRNNNDLIAQGRAIYQQGQRINPDDDPLIAQINRTPAPLELFTCAQCHGQRGEGQREGGIQAPPLRWDELTKPYTVSTSQYRQRPPYQRQRFIHALRNGIDPGNHTLDPRMPRYRLNESEINALIAYLKVIHRDQPPGVTDHQIRLWVHLPQQPVIADALDRLVDAYLDDINRNGGLYRRQLTRIRYPQEQQLDHQQFAHQQPDGQQLSNPSPVFIILDLHGPNPNPQPDIVLPQHALRISLFQHHTGENELALWPNTQGLRNSLKELAAQRWNRQASDIPRWRTAKDFYRTSERIGGVSASISILAHDSEPELLARLLGLNKDEAPKLLIEDWMSEIDPQRFSQEYAGEAYAVVPVIPENRQRGIGMRYQGLVEDYSLSGDARGSQLWGVLALEVMVESMRGSGRDLVGDKVSEQYLEMLNQNSPWVNLVPLAN